jgi:hypothetical protein
MDIADFQRSIGQKPGPGCRNGLPRLCIDMG